MTLSSETPEWLVRELTAFLDLGRELFTKVSQREARNVKQWDQITEEGHARGAHESWLESIAAAMANLGTTNCSNRSIYGAVRSRRLKAGLSTPLELEATIRRVLQAHCSSCKRYRGGPDIFENPMYGYWRLRP